MKDIDAIDSYQVIRLPQFIFLIVFEETNDTIERCFVYQCRSSLFYLTVTCFHYDISKEIIVFGCHYGYLLFHGNVAEYTG